MAKRVNNKLSRGNLGLPSLDKGLPSPNPSAFYVRGVKRLEPEKPMYPVANEDEIDVYSIDRYLNVVSQHSQHLYLDGYLGLLVLAGDEDARIVRDPARVKSIQWLYEQAEQGATDDTRNNLISDMHWHEPLSMGELDYLLDRAYMLCRTIDHIWRAWEEACVAPPSTDWLFSSMYWLHGNPVDGDTIPRTGGYTETFERALFEWSHRITRASRVHPYFAYAEVSQILKEVVKYKPALSTSLSKYLGKLIVGDTSHLRNTDLYAIRAWYLKRRFGTGSTNVARIVAPHLRGGYDEISNLIKEMKTYLSQVDEGFRSRALQSERVKVFSETLVRVLPRFE